MQLARSSRDALALTLVAVCRFAVPFVLAELLNRKEAKQGRVEAKKRRATQRDNKRKAKNQRALRRRTSSAASSAGGSRPVVGMLLLCGLGRRLAVHMCVDARCSFTAVEMTDVGLNVDDETKADAGAARPPSPTTPAAKPSTTNMGLLASAGGRAGDTCSSLKWHGVLSSHQLTCARWLEQWLPILKPLLVPVCRVSKVSGGWTGS